MDKRKVAKSKPHEKHEHHSLAKLGDNPPYVLVKQIRRPVRFKRRRILNVLGIGHIGEASMVTNNLLIRDALADVEPFIEIEPIQNPSARPGVLVVDVESVAGVLRGLVYSGVMTPPKTTLKDAVRDIQRFARPDLREDQLDRTAQIATDALVHAKGRPLSKSEQFQLQRNLRPHLGKHDGLEET